MNHFCLPGGRRFIIHVSGGRTSAYLLRQILDAHGGVLPDYARAIFTNTGKEREETLAFLREIQSRWDCPITWLEYDYRPDGPGQKNWFRVVDFDSASREGEPFATLIRSRKMLPNVVTRLCTEELKINTCQRYARVVLGWRPPRKPKPLDVIGIRYDERRRWAKVVYEECNIRHPLVMAGATKDDVTAFWDSQPFDLQLREHEGNCDLCFLKGVRKLKWLIADDPARADWWIAQEHYREHNDRTVSKASSRRFLSRYTYEDLRAMQKLPFDIPNEDAGISCFCGD